MECCLRLLFLKHWPYAINRLQTVSYLVIVIPEDKITWIEVDDQKTFTCWVCCKYPSVANNGNKVFNGTNRWHINYPIRHANAVKHANCIEKYLSEKHGTTQDIEIRFQTSTERVTTKQHLEAERLVRAVYLVVKEHLPFTKYTSMRKLQELNGLEVTRRVPDSYLLEHRI